MQKPSLLTALTLGMTLLLGACSSQPQQVQLNPQVELNTAQQVNSIIAIRSQDLRSNRFLISIHQQDQEQAELIASANNLRQSIEQQLSQAWQQQGLGVVADAPQRITIDILELASRVDESSVKYQASSTIRISVTVDTPSQTLTKQFRSNHSHEGAFSVNVNKQAEAMSQQLSQLLSEIASDPQLLAVLENQQ